MTTHDDSSTTRDLLDLDAADRELSRHQRSRAAVTLEWILATDPETSAPTVTPTRAARRRPRLLLLAGGVVAAVTAAVVVAPVVTGGTEAFASWSATPVELEGAERTAALEACLVLQSDGGGPTVDPDAPGSALLAEARGGWTYVVFEVAGSSGRELQGSCLAPEDLMADPRPGVGGFFGSLGGAEEAAGPQPAHDVACQDTSGSGSVDDATFVYAEGRAGADVVSIEVTTPAGVHVDASLENGRWAAWWPVGDDSGRSPEMREAPTYEVTLRDGTVTDGIRTPGEGA